MKKLGKILVILFTLVALVSVIAVVASADTSNDVATVTIGESVTSYTTLKKAYDAVNGNTTDATATITLLKNCAATATDVFKVTRTTGPVVFDLNGKTLNVAAARNQSAEMQYLYNKGYYDDAAAKENQSGKVAYGAISIETDGVTLTVDGNGGKITSSTVTTCPIYVLEGMENSTLYVKDVEINVTASNAADYAPIYVRGGKAYIDNCYVTTNFVNSPAIRQGANAYIEITDSLIEARAAVSSYSTAIRVDGTATSAANGVYVKDSAVIGGSSVVAAHGYDSTAASKAISGVKYGNGYNHRIETKADGTDGPDYVNNNIKFENCVIEQCDYDYKAGDTDCTTVRSTIFDACTYISIDFKDCDITGAWRLFGNSSPDTQLTVDGCNLTITGFGDIRMKKSDGTVVTGADITSNQSPMFVEFSQGKATISNSTFNYDVDGYYGKKLNAPVNVDTKTTTYLNNTVDYFQDFDEGEVGSILTVNATPLTVMSDGNGIQRKIKPNGDYEGNRTNIYSSLPGSYVGGMMRQGDISIKESDGNKYLCWDPTVVYNPYNSKQTAANSQEYVKLNDNGTAYVKATKDDGEPVNAWDLNSDGVAEYIDVNGDGTADWVDADRSGVAYNGSVKSGDITWEREIPTEYTLNEGMHQGYIGKNCYNSYASHLDSKNTRHNVSDVEYFVVDFDYSSGEGSDEFIKMSAAFEGRTSAGDATGSGFTLEANGELGSKKLVPGKWHHITCVIKLDHEDVTKSVFKAFVDGELAYTRTSGAVNADVIYIDTLRYTINNSTIYKGNATLCLDNIKETVYPAGYTDTGVEALFAENSQKDLFVWEKSYYMQNACIGVAATVNNQNKTNTTDKDGNPADPWDWYSGDVYTGYATVEAALNAAKYGDVVTLTDDVLGCKVTAPITVNTNGNQFIFNSNKFTATYSEDGRTVTFKTAKPDEITKNEIVVTVDGKEYNLGRLAIGSYPFYENFGKYEYGLDTKTGREFIGIAIDEDAAISYITDVNAKASYVNSAIFKQNEYIMFDAYGEVIEYGLYNDLTTKSTFDEREKLKNGTNLHLADGTVVRLYADVTSDKTLSFNYKPGAAANVTNYLDLNGYTITYTGTGYAVQAYRHTATIYDASGAATSGGNKGITAIVYTSREGGEICCPKNGVPVCGYATPKSKVAIDGATTAIETPVGDAIIKVGNSYAKTVMGDDYANYTVSLSGKYLARNNTYVGYVYFDNVYGEGYMYAFIADSGNYKVNNSTIVGKGANMIESGNNLCLLRVDNTVFYSAHKNNWGNLFAAIGADGTDAGRYIYFTNCSFVNMGLAGTSFTKNGIECYNKENVAFGPGCKFTNQPSITKTTSSNGETIDAYPVFLYDRDTEVDMTYGRLNEEITTPDGKKFNLAYKIATADELATITFVAGGTTTNVSYVMGGTAKYELPAYAGKVTERVVTWDKEFGKVTAADTYTATLSYKPTIPVYQNLSLYSNFKYNLYIPVEANGVDDIKNYVSSIYLDGEKQTVEETATIGGVVYYVFTVENIDSNKTAEAIVFEIELTEGDAFARGSKTLSVLGYLETALKGTNAKEKPIEYKLYQATLNYTKAAYAQFGGNATLVDTLWNTYCKDFVDDAIDTEAGTGTVNGLNTAALNLVAAPAFRFTTLDANADITVTYNFNNKIVTKSTKDGTITLVPDGDKYYFDIELRAYQFFEDIFITVDDGEPGKYNLANYYNGLAEQNELDDPDLDALLKALNTYARAAAAYNNK